LEVRFTSVYDVCEFTDPFHSNVSCPGRVYVRQAASSWGWDWAKRYSPQGIWRPVYIAFIPESKGAVTALSAIVHPAVGQPALASSFSVEVRLTVYASSAIATADVEVTGGWSGAKSSVTITAALSQGENQLSVQLQAKDVELWWPVGYGKQTMYNLTATVDGSKMTRQIGFRTSWLQTDSGVAQVGESSGSGNTSMVLLVNGQRVLVRGSSLVPLDTFNGRTSAAATRRMLLSVLRGGMNGLRVWGGGTFLPPIFYEMCVTAALLSL
jgi:beta-mannosidase